MVNTTLSMRSPREMFNQRSSLKTALKAALTQNFQKRIGNGHSTPVACTGTACCNYANSHVPLESHHDKSNCARYNEITRIRQWWWCAKSCFSGRNLNFLRVWRSALRALYFAFFFFDFFYHEYFATFSVANLARKPNTNCSPKRCENWVRGFLFDGCVITFWI